MPLQPESGTSPLLIRRSAQQVKPLASQNMLLGVTEQCLGPVPENTVAWAPGDRLLFYTFGVNFPQAFTHLALIQCAANFELYDQRALEALRGTHADRAHHSVEATSALRALWAAFEKTGRAGRLHSSRASILHRFARGPLP